MRILMLGWEYPPYISGGLGTACEGLTRGLSKHGVDVTFVVPYLYGGESAPHINLIDSFGDGSITSEVESVFNRSKTKIVKFRIPALLSPYWRPEGISKDLFTLENVAGAEMLQFVAEYEQRKLSPGGHYFDIFGEVERFTASVVSSMLDREFDLIHAHDWMTYPAGVLLSQLTGKPLVTHVHSLEYDRSGSAMNQRINEIERYGVNYARSVIAVSYYTRSVINKVHGVDLDKISVVHNGIYSKELVQGYKHRRGWSSKIVLFLGRVTFQKGPDYFVEAAAKVVPHVKDVIFVLAGSGDMLPRLQARVKELGIEENFEFPGFLAGDMVEEVFSLADVYVMPSVSEPFGISALEAISFDTPVVISRQSGVSEVLKHALKVDFWDVERMADLIINALEHQELREDMVNMAREEVKRLHWDAAARTAVDVYRSILN